MMALAGEVQQILQPIARNVEKICNNLYHPFTLYIPNLNGEKVENPRGAPLNIYVAHWTMNGQINSHMPLHYMQR